MNHRLLTQVVDNERVSANPCTLCCGINEENTRFDSKSTYNSDKRIYAHQPNLLVLEDSASRGCDICKLIFDGFRALCKEYEKEGDFRFALSLYASSASAISNDETRVSMVGYTSSLDTVPSDDTQELDSCAPIRFELVGSIEEKTARLRTHRYLPPPASNPGRIFVSRSSHGEFRYFSAVVSGRPSEDVLRFPMEISIEVFTSYDDPIAVSVPNRPISSNRLSDETFRTINNWIGTCSAQHDACGSFFRRQSLPTRVIDVGSLDCVRPVHLHLSRGEYGIYAALSYSWGTSNRNLTTTKATLEERLREIDMTLLPAVFSDAIQVCRRLAIPYLWIDALCIIQDDENDWEIEATKMATVYGLSAVTLSATMASNASDGFLKGPETGQPSIPWIDPTTRCQGRLHLRPRSRGWSELLSSDMPIMKRGWTLQERLLAPRILHYGPQMFWECWGCMCSEDEQFNLKSDASYPHLMPLVRRIPLRRVQDPQLFHKYWCEIVQDFTSRNLTYTMDKLPALSGLAHVARQNSGDEYYAGLWKSNIHVDLLWRRSSPKHLAMPSQYRAPSWSWAAVDGRIKAWEENRWLANPDNVFYKKEIEIEVVEIIVKYNPTNSLGRVESGHIDILGPMRKAQPLKEGQHYEIDAKGKNMLREGFPVEFRITEDVPYENVWTCVFDSTIAVRSKGFWLLRVLVDYARTKRYIGPGFTMLGFTYWALILEGIEVSEHNSAIDCYRRVGVAWSVAGAGRIAAKQNAARGGLLRTDQGCWNACNDNHWQSRLVRLI